MHTSFALITGLSLGLMVSLSAQAQESPQNWYDAGQQTVAENLALRSASSSTNSSTNSAANSSTNDSTNNSGTARNVILFVGDGMGVSTVTAARIFDGQLRGETGEENMLSFEEFPNVALSKTYNTNAQVADSAGTMSAMATGIKTKAGLISVNQNVVRGDCDSQTGNQILTFLEHAEMRGLSTGVVSTARLTHATPAANYAHIMDRNFEDDADATGLSNPGDCADIARQLIEFSDNVPDSDGLEVALGGGRLNFIPATENDPEYPTTGNRLDGRDLTAEWESSGADNHYVWNKEQFDAIDPATTARLLGLFEPSHMQYEFDRDSSPAGEPSLSDMTDKAIAILSNNSEGYFLQIESGRIDHAHHDTNPYRALTDAVELSHAVRTAIEKVNLDETLIIVTADHSHVFTIAGYPKRGNPILGKVVGLDDSGEPLQEPTPAADGLPYTTLSYANGQAPRTPEDFPGQSGTAESGRPDLTAIDTTVESFRPEVTVPMGAETHGGEDVAVYAIGPGSDLIRGVMEQNVIFHVMMEATQMNQR